MDMTYSPARIDAEYQSMTADREIPLVRARAAAAYTLPHVCPDTDAIQSRNHDDFIKYAANQSNGARLMQGLIATVVQLLLPYQTTLFTYDLAPKYRRNTGTLSRQQREAFELTMRTRENAISDLVYSQTVTMNRGRRTSTTLSSTTSLVAQMLVAGNACFRIDDDGGITVFPLANWAVHRDSQTDILCVIVRERIDPLELSADEQAKIAAAQPKEWETMCACKSARERLKDVHHKTEWLPDTKRWRTQSQCMGVVIASEDDTLPRYWCCADNLVPGEHYGVSLASIALPDLRTIDNLTIALRDHAELAAFCVLAVDNASLIRDSDLANLSPRQVARMSVSGGQVNDVAMLSPTNLPAFNVVQSALQSISQNMSEYFLDPSGMVRDAERTTALEVSNVTLQRFQTSLGILMQSLTEQFLPHLIRRFERIAEKMGVVQTFKMEDRELFHLRMKTGAAALADKQGATQLLAYIDAETKLAQQVLPDHIDRRRVSSMLAAKLNIDPSVVLSAAEEAKVRQQKINDEVAKSGQIAFNEQVAQGTRELIVNGRSPA